MLSRLQQGARNAIRALRTAALRVWLNVPGGRICSVQLGYERVTLHKNLWVSVTDGASTDMLPLPMVSPRMVDALRARMDALGYPNREASDHANA